ncbi:unnamed protein product [Adineta steineri]|uniref:Cadherin domain-containing protein n=1 Tax=Adineta steineri TaxID=433720 RepID=A0A818Q9C0_9BILA|nr:unnamed protein product [Adineta steineri]
MFAYDCQDICNITLSITENTLVEKLTWNLLDLLSNRTSLYEYLQFSLSKPSNEFELNSTILKYRLLELDREKICQNISINDECSLQLEIFTQTSIIIIFKMIIIDENDWKPFFSQEYIHLNIQENRAINYRIQLPIAYDYDSMKYNIDHYEFLNNTDEIERIFQIEEFHGELRLKLIKKLDCESKNNYQLYIIAIDKGGFKSNILHVNITVGDLNEYQPRFTQRIYHTSIPENFLTINSSLFPILQIIAIDDDCYDKTILYTILNNDMPTNIFPFEIDKYTGYIRVKHQLDYETISTYRFRVKASNLDHITSSIVPVVIDILDINDNQPSIQINILNEYKPMENNDEDVIININEHIHPGQVIGTILIRDIDSAMINYRLSLKILSCFPLTVSCPIDLDSEIENNTFSSTTYIIRTSRQLNSEQGDETFIIILEASDYGNPSLSSQRRLIVHVNDENDCAPKFTQSNYQFRLSHLSPVDFLIGQVHANDDDHSPNYRLIQYKLLEDNNQDIIRIDENNGYLFIAKQSLLETTFNLTVLAIDRHNHSLYDQANVQIILFDTTKCTVMFRQTIYIFNTTEHQITPYDIGQVNADDCGLSSIPISYHLMHDNSLSLFPFILDSHSGTIKVISELDREIQSSYKFYIHLFNSTSQTEVHVNILDQNDHYPIFDDIHEQYIYISTHQYYHQTNKRFIAHVHATDSDDDINGLVNYYFTHKEHYDYFHIYSNGSIILYNLFDIHLPITLEMYARDQGYPEALRSKDTVIIYVCDIFKQNECPSNKLRRNFYLGSIIIMICVVLFLLIIILCIIWNLFIKEHLENKKNNQSYNCRLEARKNLIVSDSFYDISPSIYENHDIRCVAV